MSQTLQETIGSDSWMRSNVGKVLDALPADWTLIDQSLYLRVGFKLKLIGVDWRSQDELARCLAFFEKTGLMERMGALTPESATKIRRRS